MDQSGSCKGIFVDFWSPRLSLSQIDKGIKLTFTPKSYTALSMTCLLIMQGIEKLCESFNLGAILFWIMLLHSSVSVKVPLSSIFLLFFRISYKNFAYKGIWVMALVKGILIWNVFKTLTNFLNCSSIFSFVNLWGNEIVGLSGRGRGMYGSSFSFTSYAFSVFLLSFSTDTGSFSMSLFGSFSLSFLLTETSNSFSLRSFIAFASSFGFIRGCPENIPAGAVVDTYY